MRITISLLIASAMALAGCSQGPRYCPYCGADLSAPPAARTTTGAPKPLAAPAVYKMAPAKLFDVAQQALKDKGLVIVSASAGVIQTDWKEYEGDLHIARHWQEQTRYRVSIIPDINDPTNASRFEVTEETQKRSNERAAWSPADARPQRVKEITDAIAAKATVSPT